MGFLLACTWAAFIAILIARAMSQQKHFAEIPMSGATTFPNASVLVILPTRDEEMNIERCVDRLSNQTYPEKNLVVRVVDDHSSDDTVSIAREAARRDERLSIINSPSLPSGWIGKSHACWIGACSDQGGKADWLCFMDADVYAEKNLLTTAIEYAEGRGVDVLSLAPRQILLTWTERLVLPCGLLCLAFCQDLRWLQSEQTPDATVTGQFLLVRREAYFSVGGHSSVRGEICEDLALARRLKRHGWRVSFLDGHHVLSTRMYRNWLTLKAGLAKNLVATLGGAKRTICIVSSAVLLSLATVIVPVIEAVGCAQDHFLACAGLGIALASSAAVVGLHLASAAFFKIPVWYGLAFPLGYLLGAVIAAESLSQSLSGRAIWKGRIYR